MHPRRLVQLTGLGLILLSGTYLATTTLNRSKPYPVAQIDTPAPTLGTSSHKVMLVADLACPHCRDFNTSKGKRLEQQATSGTSQLTYLLIARQDGGDVAGNAALCVFEQTPDAFWPYKDVLYDLEQVTTESVINAAANLDVDQRAFGRCVTDQEHAETLDHNERVIRRAGVQGTPTLITQGLAYSNPSTATVVEVAGE
jgi:Protein-disulfide isomerase